MKNTKQNIVIIGCVAVVVVAVVVCTIILLEGQKKIIDGQQAGLNNQKDIINEFKKQQNAKRETVARMREIQENRPQIGFNAS